MSPEMNPVLEKLRQMYFGQLDVKRLEMQQFLLRCEEGSATDEDRQSALRCAHNLSGSGKTYGYAEVSTTGRALEDAIDAKADYPALVPLIRGVLDICNDILKDQKPQAKAQTSQDSIKNPQAVKDKKPKLLIAEDDVVIMDMLKSLFSQDAEILIANNGKTALRMMEEYHPDLVILDNNMPEMSGAEVLEKVQASGKFPNTKIVMLTGSNRLTDIVRGMSGGAIDYVTKPFDPERLTSHIKRLLRHLKIQVLLADDDSAVRGLLKHKFRKLGFGILEAEDGQEAFDLIQSRHPQLVVLDRMMPGLDGLTVLRQIRDDPDLKATPVILLTAKRQNKDVVEGFDVGATDYVVKPFMPDELIARAMKWLGLSEQRAL